MSQVLSDYGHLIGASGGSIQVTTMPTYTTYPLGAVVQYVGTTTSSYTNGYFYKRGASSWERIDTQPAPTLGTAAYKNFTTDVTSESGDLVTSDAVYTAINNLPNPMVYKGTLGDNATISTLPSAATENEGFTYKVITAGTYASQAAKIGDVFVSTGSEWTLIPAGDEDNDTWRGIKVNGTEKLGNGISSGSADFIDGTYVKASFNATGNKLSFDITPAQSITESGSGLVTAGLVYTYIDTMITQALTGSY